MSTTATAGGALRASVRARRQRGVAIAAVIATLATASLLSQPTDAAFATSYPSWQDVQHAKHNANAKRAEVAKIKKVIAALDAQVAATQADAQKKGDAYQVAQDAYFTAAIKANALAAQAKSAEKTAKQSEAEAGQLAAQLARSGSDGFQLNLFLNGKDASSTLNGIGDAAKLSERAEGIYRKAVQDKNTAQALTDQANVAKTILDSLKVAAQNAYNVAQKAATAAATALAASTAHKSELEAQLTALTTKEKITQASYLKGLKAQFGYTGGLGTFISSSGWARPTVGVITSPFGMRVNPIDGGYRLHTGTDIADGCGVPIYAAHTGTVTYSGWYGDLGNYIQVEVNGTISNGYGHIVNGGLLVGIGQHVQVGQLIARTGMTGGATGCHLHFMVIQDGAPINPVPFMRNQGVTLG